MSIRDQDPASGLTAAGVPFNAPPGSTSAATAALPVRDALTTSPQAAPLPDAAHPLGAEDGRGTPKVDPVVDRASLERKIDALRDDLAYWWRQLEQHEGSVAGDAKTIVKDSTVKLDALLLRGFGRPSPK